MLINSTKIKQDTADDYPIFFAVSEKGDKDNSGDYIYVKNGNGQYKLDLNGHLIVEHDLHSHEGELCGWHSRSLY